MYKRLDDGQTYANGRCCTVLFKYRHTVNLKT